MNLSYLKFYKIYTAYVKIPRLTASYITAMMFYGI
jgi:hypothetical protein